MGNTSHLLALQTQPFVAIIIPTRDKGEDLVNCLHSIEGLAYPHEKIEIIVWDNDSDTSSRAIVREKLTRMKKGKWRRIEYIENDRNFGVYDSRHELINRIHPDIDVVCSLDDDVILPENLLQEALTVFHQNPSVGIIGPRTVYDSHPHRTAHGAGFVDQRFGRYTDLDASDSTECDYVIGCCMLMRKAAIEKTGNFDRDFFTSHGEVDYCLRMKQKGYTVLYFPAVTVRHNVGVGGRRTPERLYYVFRNKVLIIRRHLPSPNRWIALAIYFLIGIPRSIVAAIAINKDDTWQEIRAILDGMVDGFNGRTGRRDR